MPSSNAELIRRFYAAFAARDGGAMAAFARHNAMVELRSIEERKSTIGERG